MSKLIKCIICHDTINTFENCIDNEYIQRLDNTCPICRTKIYNKTSESINENTIISVIEIYSSKLYQFNSTLSN